MTGSQNTKMGHMTLIMPTLGNLSCMG